VLPQLGRLLLRVVPDGAGIGIRSVERNPLERQGLLALADAHAPGKGALALPVDLDHRRSLGPRRRGGDTRGEGNEVGWTVGAPECRWEVRNRVRSLRPA